MTTQDLLSEIDGFLSRTGMAASRFGRQFMRDPSFVADLRSGQRECFPSTAQGLLDKMRGWRDSGRGDAGGDQ